MFVNTSAVVRVVSLHCFLALAVQSTHGQEQPSASQPKNLDEVLSKSMTVTFDETPLRDTIVFLREVTKANIVLPQWSLDVVMISDDTPITFAVRNVSLRSVLNLLLDPLELTYVEKPGVLLIVPRNEAPTIIRQYDVGDLIYTRENGRTVGYANSLRELLLNSVAPGSWDENGGTGSVKFIYPATFVVSQSPMGHRDVAQALTFLRHAGQLRTNAEQMPLVIKEHSDSIAAVERALEKPVTFDFQETALVEVVAFFNEVTRVNILLDQVGLDIVMIDRDTPITLSLNEVPIAEALEMMLSEFGLTTIIKNEILVITDMQETGQELRLQLYPSADPSWREWLTSAVSPDSWAENGGTGQAHYFAASQCWAVLQTQKVHGEIEKLTKSVHETSQRFTKAAGQDGRPEMAEVQAAAKVQAQAATAEQKRLKSEKQHKQMLHEKETRLRLERELFEAQVRKAKAEAELLEKQLKAETATPDKQK